MQTFNLDAIYQAPLFGGLSEWLAETRQSRIRKPEDEWKRVSGQIRGRRLALSLALLTSFTLSGIPGFVMFLSGITPPPFLNPYALLQTPIVTTQNSSVPQPETVRRKAELLLPVEAEAKPQHPVVLAEETPEPPKPETEPLERPEPALPPVSPPDPPPVPTPMTLAFQRLEPLSPAHGQPLVQTLDDEGRYLQMVANMAGRYHAQILNCTYRSDEAEETFRFWYGRSPDLNFLAHNAFMRPLDPIIRTDRFISECPIAYEEARSQAVQHQSVLRRAVVQARQAENAEPKPLPPQAVQLPALPTAEPEGLQPEILQLQQALRQNRCYDGPLTGRMDTQTQEAIRLYQAAQGMEANGQISPQMLSQLYRFSSKIQSACPRRRS